MGKLRSKIMPNKYHEYHKQRNELGLPTHIYF